MKGKGFNVFYIDERPSNSTLFKTLLRAGLIGLLRNKIYQYYARAIEAITSDNIEHILIINPEAIDSLIIERLRNKYPAAQVTIYMWDSLQNKKLAHLLFDKVDQVFTFDSYDCKQSAIELLPLFYAKKDAPELLAPEQESSLFFIGNIHSDRLNSIDKLDAGFVASGKRFYKLLYYPSKILFLLAFLKNPRVIKKFYHDIILKPVAYSRVVAMMANAECILDLVHPKQTGLTMRTMETLGLRKKLITNNVNIRNYDFYNPELHYVIDPDNLKINEVIKFIDSSPALSLHYQNIVESYSVDIWLDRLLGRKK
ncbi:hypothetical protein [Pantoea sp. B65]|uniref:hypothetical protein n=1 Tax=Pantoea sp. B65 TaxID=2813359 RepID=UPI0039B4E946